MRSKILSKWSLFIVGIMGIIFFSMINSFMPLDLPGQTPYVEPVLFTEQETLQDLVDVKPAETVRDIVLPEQTIPLVGETGPGLPIRLKIPNISVDSAFEYVSLTSGGAMDVSKDIANVAWFDIGPRPGENGSAVIAGHYGKKNGKASVFDNLYKLHSGDKLTVEDENGSVVSFVVRKIQRYDPSADATDVFISNDGKAHLNLITCEGVWNKISKSYSKRLVVFTDKE